MSSFVTFYFSAVCCVFGSSILMPVPLVTFPVGCFSLYKWTAAGPFCWWLALVFADTGAVNIFHFSWFPYAKLSLGLHLRWRLPGGRDCACLTLAEQAVLFFKVVLPACELPLP